MPSAEEKKEQRNRENARRDVLAFLAIRAPNAFKVAAIRTRLNREGGSDYTEEEIEAAVLFLVRLTPPEVEQIFDRLGANHAYRATPQGQLAYERGDA